LEETNKGLRRAIQAGIDRASIDDEIFDITRKCKERSTSNPSMIIEKMF
jgi:hypothetical protein